MKRLKQGLIPLLSENLIGIILNYQIISQLKPRRGVLCLFPWTAGGGTEWIKDGRPPLVSGVNLCGSVIVHIEQKGLFVTKRYKMLQTTCNKNRKPKPHK